VDAVSRHRRELARAAARPLGVQADHDRLWQSSVRLLGSEAELLALPLDAAAVTDLQDPSTGALYFMVDASEIDGSDPLR